MSNGFLEPKEEKLTEWYNPLEQEQIVDITHDGDTRPTRYRWAPNETKSLPSRFDRAIHFVHNGVIIAGLAPLLIKVGSDEKLDQALDPNAAEKQAAQAKLALAAEQRRLSGEAMLLAAGTIAAVDGATQADDADATKQPKGKKG